MFAHGESNCLDNLFQINGLQSEKIIPRMGILRRVEIFDGDLAACVNYFEFWPAIRSFNLLNFEARVDELFISIQRPKGVFERMSDRIKRP